MMSLSVIARLAREQHRKAARAKLVPLVVEGEDMPDDARLATYLRHIPNIGTYRPKGWRLVERLFVDKSGFGAEWEPAMTLRQFIEAVRKAGPGNGYAIIEEGEFQVYVGRFEPRKGRERRQMIITTTDANTGKPLRLRLAPGDIEEAIARCGWTILNTAAEVSEEDTAEVARIEAQGFAGMPPRTSLDALAWWNARIMREG